MYMALAFTQQLQCYVSGTMYVRHDLKGSVYPAAPGTDYMHAAAGIQSINGINPF